LFSNKFFEKVQKFMEKIVTGSQSWRSISFKAIFKFLGTLFEKLHNFLESNKIFCGKYLGYQVSE